MSHEYFEKWTEMARKVQAPWQEIVELNVKTLQNMNYIKPEELASLKKPEELFEKQIKLLIENGHKTLDHMQRSFEIVEKAMLSLVQEARAKREEVQH